MSHELAIAENGEAEMMYVGPEVPWHKLGQKLDNPATSAEAISAAHLDWRVEKVPMQLIGSNIPVPKKAATVRMNSDGTPKEVFGVVGSEYSVLNNVEAFDFFDSVIGSKQAVFTTAGALNGGRRVWLLAQLPYSLMIKGKDKIDPLILLSNSFDGSGAIQLMQSPLRVVCGNTLNIALQDGTDRISIRHTKNAKSKVTQAREALGISISYYRKFEEIGNYLASIQINGQIFLTFINRLFPTKEGASKVIIDHTDVIKNQVAALFESNDDNRIPEVKGTMWNAFNAATNFADYGKTVRKESAENRLNSIWFGNAVDLKNKAMEICLDLSKSI